MRILFVTGEYPPMVGGVGAYTAELARALVAQGAGVAVLTSAQAAGGRAATDGVAVEASVGRWGPAIWRTVAERAAAFRADWIHVQYQTAAFGMNPAINAGPARWRRAGGPCIAWTYHDLLVPYLFPKAGGALRRAVTERPARSADLVIATNEADRRALALLRPDVALVPIGSNIAGVTLDGAARAAVRARYGFGPGDLLLGYFGFLNRSKGADTLIAALARLVRQGLDAHLLMIGDRLGASDPTNAAILAALEAKIGGLGLVDRVHWTGRLDDDAAAAALNCVDLLLLPFADGASLRRGTLMAGLANGCAIVTTTPAAPLPELVDGRDLLYVAPGDDAALAAAAARLAGDAPLRAALGAAARARSTLFRWDSIAARHLELYAQHCPPR